MQAGLSAHFSDSNQKLPSRIEEEDGIYEVCIANISPLERRKRLRFAILQFAIGTIILAGLLLFGVDKFWRLPLFFIFAASGASYFQWRDKT